MFFSSSALAMEQGDAPNPAYTGSLTNSSVATSTVSSSSSTVASNVTSSFLTTVLNIPTHPSSSSAESVSSTASLLSGSVSSTQSNLFNIQGISNQLLSTLYNPFTSSSLMSNTSRFGLNIELQNTLTPFTFGVLSSITSTSMMSSSSFSSTDSMSVPNVAGLGIQLPAQSSDFDSTRDYLMRDQENTDQFEVDSTNKKRKHSKSEDSERDLSFAKRHHHSSHLNLYQTIPNLAEKFKIYMSENPTS